MSSGPYPWHFPAKTHRLAVLTTCCLSLLKATQFRNLVYGVTEVLPDSLLSLDTGNQAKSVVQRMHHPLNSPNSARSRLYKSMSAAGRHMREQQVHPPLAVALQMILESHKCDGKGSVEGLSPVSR